MRVCGAVVVDCGRSGGGAAVLDPCGFRFLMFCCSCAAAVEQECRGAALQQMQFLFWVSRAVINLHERLGACIFRVWLRFSEPGRNE